MGAIRGRNGLTNKNPRFLLQGRMPPRDLELRASPTAALKRRAQKTYLACALRLVLRARLRWLQQPRHNAARARRSNRARKYSTRDSPGILHIWIFWTKMNM